MQQDVGVPFDEPWQERQSWQIDDSSTGSCDVRCRSGCLDVIPLHTNRPTLVDRFAIEDSGWSEDRDRRLRLANRGGLRQNHSLS